MNVSFAFEEEDLKIIKTYLKLVYIIT